MERVIITINKNGRVNIPSANVWMSEMELVELFGVTAPTLRAAIRAIYKSGTLSATTTQRCDLVTPTNLATFYNIEVVIALTFRLNTYKASRIRQKVLESLYQQREKEVGFFVLLNNNVHLNSNYVQSNIFRVKRINYLANSHLFKSFLYLCI